MWNLQWNEELLSVLLEQEVKHQEGLHMEEQLRVWNQDGPSPAFYL